MTGANWQSVLLPGGTTSSQDLPQDGKKTAVSGEEKLKVPADGVSLPPIAQLGDYVDVPLSECEESTTAVSHSVRLWALNDKVRVACMDLAYAAADNDVDELKRLLLGKADPNTRDFEHRTALHVASGHGRLEAARVLLESRADPNVSDTMGRTPLSMCDRGGAEVEQLLRTYGAGVQLERVRKLAKQELWSIKREDVKLRDVLGETLKSRVHRGTWKNVEVVAKLCLDTSEMKPDDLQEEMLHEITILARLRHPDLVMFLGACVHDEPIMFLTEFMPGGDLEHYFKQRRAHKGGDIWRPSVDQSKLWSSATLRALSFLHNLDTPLIHRDLKPLNLLLSKDLTLKVTDFGISKIIRPVRTSKEKGGKLVSQESYCMTGGVGSWKYMAPEVTRHQAYTTKVDIYSFGLILFFITSGKAPFYEFSDPVKVLDLYVEGQEPRPRASEGYRAFRALMEAAWAADPQSRPHAQECLTMLQSVEVGGNTSCGPCTSM